VRLRRQADAQQGADELEAEGEIGSCGDKAEGAEGDLHQWVDERAEGRVRGRAVGGEDAGPEVEAVDVLPVVDCFVALVAVVCDAAAEVDGELADEGEAGGVADRGVNAPELGAGVLHQVYAGDAVDGGVAAAFYEALVCGFEGVLADAGVADHCQSSEDEEGGNAGCFGGCAG